MITKLKGLLFRILGRDNYLRLLHAGFFLLFDFQLLRKNENYKYNYFVKKIIAPNDVVVDIGANLGYFSKIFSRLVGKNGKVICIEPVKPFFEVLKWGLRNKTNCTLNNYALGTESKNIELVLPKFEGTFRTGLSHIPTEDENKENSYIFETQMVRGSELLSNLSKIDYVKIDIEGYEKVVLNELAETIKKHKPIMQIETWGQHKADILALMSNLGYSAYTLDNETLIEDLDASINEGDILFVHSEKKSTITPLLKNK